MPTKLELEAALEDLIRDAEHICDEWLENDESWCAYADFRSAIKLAKKVINARD